MKKQAKKDRNPFFAISSVTNTGVQDLVFEVSRLLSEQSQAEKSEVVSL
jgi:hypothetical protein